MDVLPDGVAGLVVMGTDVFIVGYVLFMGVVYCGETPGKAGPPGTVAVGEL